MDREHLLAVGFATMQSRHLVYEDGVVRDVPSDMPTYLALRIAGDSGVFTACEMSARNEIMSVALEAINEAQ